MSIELVLYRTLDGRNVANKVLTNPIDTTINLRRKDDLVSMTLLIKTVEPIVNQNINYCYIGGSVNRYYFINGLSVAGNGLYRLELEVDVVQTYRTQLINVKEKTTSVGVEVDKTIIESDGGLVEGEFGYVLVTLGSEEVPA